MTRDVKPQARRRAHGAMLGSAYVALIACSLASARADAPAAEPGVVNEQGPVHILWSVTGDFGTPGPLGLRAAVHGWAPKVPVYVAAQGQRAWGLSPTHIAGERDGVLSRHLTKYQAWEVRAGISIGTWHFEEIDTKYSFDTTYRGTTVSWKEASYRPRLPVYHRRTLYAGYRSRSVPGADACPDMPVEMFTEDCSELHNQFLMVGFSSVRAIKATFNTQSHGRLRYNNYRLLDLRITYADGDQYARDSLATRLGAELMFTYGKGRWAFGWGVGWDGQLALITMSLGAGSQYSFAAPPTL